MVAKIIMNLSNLRNFKDGGKEEFMIPFDDIIIENIDAFKEFINNATVFFNLT